MRTKSSTTPCNYCGNNGACGHAEELVQVKLSGLSCSSFFTEVKEISRSLQSVSFFAMICTIWLSQRRCCKLPPPNHPLASCGEARYRNVWTNPNEKSTDVPAEVATIQRKGCCTAHRPSQVFIYKRTTAEIRVINRPPHYGTTGPNHSAHASPHV